STTTYDLTATGQGGTVHCQATVSVNQPPAAPTCTLSANPTSIVSGNSSTLSWTTSNASSVTLSPNVGSVSPGGSLAVTPSQTITYTLTATGQGGTVNCNATITVT